MQWQKTGEMAPLSASSSPPSIPPLYLIDNIGVALALARRLVNQKCPETVDHPNLGF